MASQASTVAGSDDRGQYDDTGTRPPGRRETPCRWSGPRQRPDAPSITDTLIDVLLVSALISILVVLAFTDWGVLAYVLTGLVFAALLLASAITNSRRRATRR